jgi:hypothetical protein
MELSYTKMENVPTILYQYLCTALCGRIVLGLTLEMREGQVSLVAEEKASVAGLKLHGPPVVSAAQRYSIIIV